MLWEQGLFNFILIMGTITTVTTVIKDPSKKMLDLVQRMREHKHKMREENRQLKPLYTIKG